MSKMATINLEELHTYHGIDRNIFARLVIRLVRNPAQSLLVMATWLWLEDLGYPNIIAKMINQPDAVVNALADEAALALRCLEIGIAPALAGYGMPQTTKVMQTTGISLKTFIKNKHTAISGIKSVLKSVCGRVFADILWLVLQQVIPDGQPLAVPGFPHRLFGDVAIVPRPPDYAFPIWELWGWNPINNVPEDERTLFLTFSRGFPVSEEEVREFFTAICGKHGVVKVHMPDHLHRNQQVLYARIVLRSVTAVDMILDGQQLAKYQTLKGKHIWARKYDRMD